MADPLAEYLYGQINTPQAFTGAMENLGFQGTPFGGVQQSYNDVENFQRSLKRILDLQLGAFNQGNNVNMLPANLRGMFNAAAPIMTDPAWGIIGAPGMFSNGYQMGELPGNRTMAHQQFYDRNNAPPPLPIAAPQNIAAPQMNNSLNVGSGGGSTPNRNQQFTIPINGPNGSGAGNITVNAQDYASALINATQGGNTVRNTASVPPPYVAPPAPKQNQQSGSAFKMGFK